MLTANCSTTLSKAWPVQRAPAPGTHDFDNLPCPSCLSFHFGADGWPNVKPEGVTTLLWEDLVLPSPDILAAWALQHYCWTRKVSLHLSWSSSEYLASPTGFILSCGWGFMRKLIQPTNLLLVKGAGWLLDTRSICLSSVISGMCLIH